jgi:chemotaxis regulatin CheY-phosphate phosphatase CheZ
VVYFNANAEAVWRKELKMPSEMGKFQRDLLESVKQMKRDEAARTTHVKLPEAAEA